MVGLLVSTVGPAVGSVVGYKVGDSVGSIEGELVGDRVGRNAGSLHGCSSSLQNHESVFHSLHDHLVFQLSKHVIVEDSEMVNVSRDGNAISCQPFIAKNVGSFKKSPF